LALQTAVSRLARTVSHPFTIFADYESGGKISGQEKAVTTAKLNMKEVTIQENGDDHMWVSLGIDYYQPEQLPENWVPQEFASIIEFWEIDPEYDGAIFNSCYQVFNPQHQKNGMLPLNILLSLPRRKTYRIAVKVHDCYAGQQIHVLHLSFSGSALE
jgi:hypothetical protein